MLGTLIMRLHEPGTAEETLVAAGDLLLLAALSDAAARLNLSTGDFASLAIHRFVERADDDEWLQLTTVMDRTEEPGVAALRAILSRAVADSRAAMS